MINLVKSIMNNGECFMIKYYWKNKKEFVKMIKENKVTVVVIATIILGALIEEIWQIKAIMMLMKGF